MAFPQVADTNTSIETGNETSHTVSLPANISEGDLLLIFFATDGDNTISNWDGFTELASESNSGWAFLAIAYKKATGAEGASITVVTTSAEESAHAAYRIEGAEDPGIQAPNVSAKAEGASDSPNPNSVTPVGGAKDYLWIAAEGHDEDKGPISYPTNYNDNQITAESSVSYGCTISVGSRENNAVSDDPDAFLIDGTDQWVAFTVAVHPAAGAPPEGTNLQLQIGGAWVAVDGMQIQIGGAWKAVDGVQVQIGGAWKKVF